MKIRIFTLLLTLWSVEAFAQNDLRARIQFEDAETAFASKDYATAITHLTEAEKLLGKWTPKVGYLMILSLNKLINFEKPDRALFDNLLDHTDRYMTHAQSNTEVDPEKFKEIYSVEQHLGNLMNNLGVMYSTGKGIAQSDQEVFRWYQKAAEKGNVDAMNNLGFMYDKGKGIAQNYQEALRWYHKAAEKGHVEAMCNLGVMYYTGDGVANNIYEALRWYQKAAEKGDVDAMNDLAIIYYSGKDFPQDYQMALNWLIKGYKAGRLNMRDSIASIYETGGYGVKQDKKLAEEWRNN